MEWAIDKYELAIFKCEVWSYFCNVHSFLRFVITSLLLMMTLPIFPVPTNDTRYADITAILNSMRSLQHRLQTATYGPQQQPQQQYCPAGPQQSRPSIPATQSQQQSRPSVPPTQPQQSRPLVLSTEPRQHHRPAPPVPSQAQLPQHNPVPATLSENPNSGNVSNF